MDESSVVSEKLDSDWKLIAPDETAEITFVNGNSYKGRISRKKMEGHGVYRWRNGAQYTASIIVEKKGKKNIHSSRETMMRFSRIITEFFSIFETLVQGHFEDNKIHGKGRIEWPNGAWYEGDFENGYRHGKGMMLDKDRGFLYLGHWEHDRKHGTGYFTYIDVGSYDGDWIMDKPEGSGIRNYPNGSRYVGKWKGAFRHGTGTMTWPNGDVYRGEWKNGAMHGYGEYTWNGFLNKTLSWPQEACYMGEWQEGTRTGRGQITLNSVGGARYSGEWRENKKHGTGTIIGNNGEITEVLFENDILQALGKPESRAGKSEAESKNVDKSGRGTGPGMKSTEKTDKLLEACTTTVAQPEQHVSLDHYLDRLRPKKSSPSSVSLVSLTSERSETKGRCGVCENESCRCLSESGVKSNVREEAEPSTVPPKVLNSSLTPTSKNPTTVARSRRQNVPVKTSDSEISEMEMNLEKEKYWTYNCITTHMPRIRKIYDDYAKIFANVTPKCRLSMSRLALWQLWRDCGVHKKFLSLVQIDNHLAANESTLMGNSSCPFERIEIWQLIHAFLEVSWHFYTKNGEHDATTGYPGKLANGLNTFLINDIYKNVGKCTGGENLKVSSESLPAETSMPEFLMGGRNSVTVGEKLSFFINDETSLLQPKPRLISIEGNDRSDNSLHAFRELGSKAFIDIMSSVCPMIRDSETGAIINIQYELSFLEFLEIFIEAGKRLVLQRKMRKESSSEHHEIEEKDSSQNVAKDEELKRSNIRISSVNKAVKTKKRLSSRR
ncbi:uncharacterized protein [Venturia canescens]|uniref:uncharacterized protein n=1 Tax=Venturia canescens TaxID=32260 RepID=UPI001C9C29B6|nr:uncharacterized protein LOC122410440 [Venturia canescens]